jgi:hypothetical protein
LVFLLPDKGGNFTVTHLVGRIEEKRRWLVHQLLDKAYSIAVYALTEIKVVSKKVKAYKNKGLQDAEEFKRKRGTQKDKRELTVEAILMKFRKRLNKPLQEKKKNARSAFSPLWIMSTVQGAANKLHLEDPEDDRDGNELADEEIETATDVVEEPSHVASEGSASEEEGGEEGKDQELIPTNFAFLR